MRAVKSRHAEARHSADGAADAAAGAATAPRVAAAAAVRAEQDDAVAPQRRGSTADDEQRGDPLAIAFADEAPLTFTARDDPRVVARLPLRLCDLLPVVCQQLQYRQRQATHQTSVDATPYEPAAHPLSAPPAPQRQQQQQQQQAPASGHPQPPYAHAHLSDMVVRLLPTAVGLAPPCTTALMHPNEAHDTDMAASSTTTDAAPAAPPAAAAEAERNHADTPVPEHTLYRMQATEKILDYLLPSPAPSPTTATTTAAAAAADVGSPDRDEARQRFTIEACLSGLREVACDSAEYVLLLQQLIDAADAAAAAAAPTDDDDDDGDGDGADTFLDVPAYVRQLLLGTPPPAKTTPTSPNSRHGGAGEDGGRGRRSRGVRIPAAVGGGSGLTYGAVERAPVVTSTLRATMDAVLPPRLFVYFAAHHETAVAVQRQRRSAQQRQAHLRRHLAAHPDDAAGQAELEALGEALVGELAEAPVGAIFIILERTSDVQAPRDYLAKLEHTVDDVLREVQARCCGRPLRLANSSSAPVSHTPSPPPSAAGAGKSTKLKSGRSTSTAGHSRSAAAGDATLTTTILATPDKSVCTRTLKPPGAQPAAVSISGGGSATVAATLNVLELNKERTLVQLSLLGEELLRQVTVDLPERGVLLRRLLDEAQLSIDARAIVARERAAATLERLLDGQDAREVTVEQSHALTSEVDALHARLAYVKARKAALKTGVEERRARELVASRERAHFETSLRERLTLHTERVKAAQDAARRSSLPG
ncbi:Axonemal dynein light chain [Novymonas esmeraldas]|uniref:Axonemal dynein light chain n=1 Tax=Novymonas esmeraldas TaxID=1808958 RepID=A0AAW0F8X3_9TRYP